MTNNGVDLMKYERKPLSNNVSDLKKEIKELRTLLEDESPYMSQVENQLILDRIGQCEDKIQSLTTKEVKIVPVLGTTTIAESRSRRKQPKSVMVDNRIIL